MSNDPKDTVVDLSKLVRTSASTPLKTPSNTNKMNASTLLTTCNESADLIGHENFTLKESKKTGK